jgi:hypothetical protein
VSTVVQHFELDPAQPDEVTRAIAELLDDESPSVDPWWRAGVEENLADDS